MSNKYKYEKNMLFNLIDNKILELLKEEQCIIAGGCITSLFTRHKINDIDIYFRSKKSLIKALLFLEKSSHLLKAFTDKATLFETGGQDYQFIHFKFFDNAEEIFDTFDFTVCMGAYDFKTNEFIFHEDFLCHNSQRLIRFNSNTAYPLVSMLRLQKYKGKGYDVSKFESIKVGLAINKLKLDTYKKFKEAIGGMYGINYDEIFKDIKDKEPFEIDKAIDILSNLDITENKYKYDGEYYANLDEELKNYLHENLLKCGFKIYKVLKNISWDKEYMYILADNNKIIDILDKYEVTEDDNNADEYRYKITDDMLSDNNDELYLYKNIKYKDGIMSSFYDDSFKYELNKEIVAKNKEGLFLSKSPMYVQFSEKDYATTIKVKVKVKDIINNLNVTKCIPVEIIENHKNTGKRSK